MPPSISTMIRPALGCTMPMMLFASVLLPLLLAPSSTTVSPASTLSAAVLEDAHRAVGGVNFPRR